MRHPDLSIDGSTHVWRVPMDRLTDWVAAHPEVIFQGSRDDRFPRLWRDLYYMRIMFHGGDYDDEVAESGWIAVSLRDLRQTPDYPRAYREAEWEVRVEKLARVTPPVNGDGLYDTLPEPPLLVYHFHGLDEERILNVGDGNSFAVFGVEAFARGPRPEPVACYMLSLMVNALRERDGKEPLAITTGDPLLLQAGLEPSGTGLLAETDDGVPVTGIR